MKILDNFKNKNIVIVGAGMTGISTAKLLKKLGANIILNDINKIDVDINKIKKIEGRHPKELFLNADMIILSPGVRKNILPLEKIKQNKIPIIGDIELFYLLNDSKIIGVTGTNGKTTTTTLIGELLKTKYEVFIGGNIGTPVLEKFNQKIKSDISILELSSFQLELINKFYADFVVILNISPDHLDRYKNFSQYVEAKLNILRNQKPEQKIIVNENIELYKYFNNIKGKVYTFNINKQIINNFIIVEVNNKRIELDCNKIKLKGKHFYEDIIAATIIALLNNINEHLIKKVIYNFKGLEHRLEFLGKINDIKFYNDSKSTTLDSTIKAIESFNEKIILLIGGIYKGGNFNLLNDYSNIKQIIIFGKDRLLIKKQIEFSKNVLLATNLEEAFNLAISNAEKKEIILLSPACASFDEFSSYIERGNFFKKLVKNYKNEKEYIC